MSNLQARSTEPLTNAKDANGTKAELRLLKQKMAVKEDALEEMRADYSKMRKVMQRAFGLLEQRKVKIPEDLKAEYDKLMEQDGKAVKKEAVKMPIVLHEDEEMKDAEEDEGLKY